MKTERAKNLWFTNSYKNQSSLVDWIINQEGFSIGRNSRNFGLNEEVMEWHSVNDWMANKLIEEGEFMIQFEGENFWGRQTTGMSVWYDYVITKIFDDWEEGIKN